MRAAPGEAEGPEVELKDQQRTAWARVARAWRDWSPLHRGCTRPVSQALVEAAAVGPGARVLDVACGPGDPALELAWRIRPGGRVVATDLSEDMLATARAAAAAEGLEDVEFLVADGGRPPAGPFDAVTCRFGLMFFPDPAATVAAWRAVVRPGGRIACAVWTSSDENPSGVLRTQAARDALGVELAPAGPGMLALSAPGALEEVLRAAGLGRIAVRRVTMCWAGPDATTLARMFVELNPPLERHLSSRPVSDRQKVVAALAGALGAYADGRGVVSLPAAAWVGSGLA